VNLTDDQIREVLQNAYHQGAQPMFLQSFAAAVLQAPYADFSELRPVSLSIIQKYELWRYLMGEQPPLKPSTIEGELAKRKLLETCPRCGHVHKEPSECGEDMGGGRVCLCEYWVPTTAARGNAA
jgi:hypothetical protein